VRIQDDAVGRTTTYRYDLAGRHIRETTVQGGETYQDNHIAYDALGRMRWVADGRVTVTVDYDAVGNRTHVHTSVNDGRLENQASDSDYQYDAMNRQTVADGHTLEYDRNGNRIKDTSAAGVETYTYDALNRLTVTTRDGTLVEERDYDAAHRVVRTATPAGTRTNTYDANGRLKHQDIVEPGSNWSGINYDYDDVGNLKSTLVADLVSQTFSGSTNTYEQGEGYRLKSTTNVLQNLGELIYNYDANGHLASTNNVYELNSANRDHLFINDAAGNVLHTYYLDSATHQGVNAQRQLVVNGEVLGRYGEVATSRVPFPGYPNWTLVNYEAQADFSFGAQGINSQYPAGTPASRVVQDGDTLRGIAQTAYGNAALWYVIAEANGLSSDADLVSGQVLKLPPVVDSANNADTFRPYDPSRIVNDTPTMLAMPQGKDGGCGGVGAIIVAAVAVVVAAVTQQWYLVNVAGYAGGTAAAVGAGAYGSLAAAGAVGMAAGSIVSQGVGIAIGVQDSFSWRQVALSAVSGGVTGGLGGVNFTGASDLAGGASTLGNQVIQRALGNALTQGVAVATGLQSSFSWRSVAASALSPVVSQGLGGLMNYGQGAGFDPFKSVAIGVAGSAVAQLAVNGRINTTQLATDAFGNVIGDALARGSISGGAAEKAGDDRAQNIASMLKSADRAAGSEENYFAGAAGKSAWPVEVSSQAGYLSSMFPEPQVVASELSGPVPTYLYDTDALASGVIQRNVVGSALPAGPSLASAPDLGVVEAMRASGLPYYDGLVASNDSLESAAGRIGRGLFNAGYDFAATGSTLYELGTNADLRARAIMNGVNAIAHPIDTAIGIYNAGENYFKTASIGQIGEDGIRLLAGTAIGGAGSKGLTLIGDLADGATTVGRLTPQLTAEGLPYSRLVAGGGLDAHEAAGGHLLAKHVGQTEQVLAQRLANEPWISGSSSFYDRSIAEAAISRSLDAKQAEIASWLGTSKPQTSITFTLPENVGITMSQGSAGAVDTASLKLILRRDASMSTGYRIHTGYPE